MLHQFFYGMCCKKFSFTRINAVDDIVVSFYGFRGKLYGGIEAGFDLLVGELGEKDPDCFL